MMEYLIELFTLEISNIVILVVKELKFSDQNLINRIEDDLKKQLLIVHNFKDSKTIEEIEY